MYILTFFKKGDIIQGRTLFQEIRMYRQKLIILTRSFLNFDTCIKRWCRIITTTLLLLFEKHSEVQCLLRTNLVNVYLGIHYMCTGLENKAIKMNFLSYEIIKKQKKYFHGTLKENDQNCNDVRCMLQ